MKPVGYGAEESPWFAHERVYVGRCSNHAWVVERVVERGGEVLSSLDCPSLVLMDPNVSFPDGLDMPVHDVGYVESCERAGIRLPLESFCIHGGVVKKEQRESTNGSFHVPYSSEEDEILLEFMVRMMKEDQRWLSRPRSLEMWRRAVDEGILNRSIESMRNRAKKLSDRCFERLIADGTLDAGGRSTLEEVKNDLGVGRPIATPYTAEEDEEIIAHWVSQALLYPVLRIKPLSRLIWEKAESKNVIPGRTAASMKTRFRKLSERAMERLENFPIDELERDAQETPSQDGPKRQRRVKRKSEKATSGGAEEDEVVAHEGGYAVEDDNHK